jgi:hypothetical protein
MPEKLLNEVMAAYSSISKEKFFEIYNQSGMDHELIGHGYHHFKNLDCGEETAVRTQLKMAEARAKGDQDWKRITEVMPAVLSYLKGIKL